MISDGNEEVISVYRKVNLVFLLMILFIGLAGCTKNSDIPSDDEWVFAIPEEYRGIMEDKKVYITSIGQSIDIENFMINIVHFAEEEKYDFNYVYDTELEASEVESSSIVFLIVGCSIKAMSDAGITVNSELARAEEFVSLKERGKITLISWHLGGMSRRGTTSDRLIELVFSASDINIFVKSGNSDGLLAKISMENEVAMYQIATISAVTEPLMFLLASD